MMFERRRLGPTAPLLEALIHRPVGRFIHLCHFIHLIRLLITAIIVPSSPILATLMMEALNSSET
jgi:hypothetical protein